MTSGLHPQTVSYSRILRIAGPLILSHTSVMLMQVVDGLFLSRYSPDAIAAVGPAGMSAWLVLGLFMGMCGYSNTFVAQFVGADASHRAGAAVWQAMYLSLLCGGIAAALSVAAGPLFHVMGHAPAITANEITYFRILCWGGPWFLLSAAVAGFFAGRNDNVPLMVVHLSGAALNALLDWLLIFGRAGLPQLGVAGAAGATVAAHAFIAAALLAIFFLPRFRQRYGTWADRAMDWPLLGRLVRFGFPNGLRNIVEILAWTLFLVFVGRVSSSGLAASNIAWRLNVVAFFPLLGLSTAVSMLVGQAQGASRPDQAERATWRGLAIGEVWMILISATFVLFPHTLIAPFLDPQRLSPHEYRALLGTCTVLLRFVAAYCLLDALNIFFMASLQGAGDTRWTLGVSAVAHLLYVLALMAVVWAGGGLYALWTAATVFVMGIAGVWAVRFRGGQWRHMRVIEPPPLVAAASTPGATEIPLPQTTASSVPSARLPSDPAPPT